MRNTARMKALFLVAAIILAVGWNAVAFSQQTCTPEARERVQEIQEEVIHILGAIMQGRINLDQATPYVVRLRLELAQLAMICPDAIPAPGGGSTGPQCMGGVCCDDTGCY